MVDRPARGGAPMPSGTKSRSTASACAAGGGPPFSPPHNPVGVVSTNRAQDGRPTVVDLVASPRRLFPVGRLDADSEGLILLTDDGDLAQELSHPRYGHEKEYRVQLDRAPDAKQLEAWGPGARLARGRP